MAVDYTNLFEDVGEFVEAVNAFKGLYTTLDGYEGEIETELTGNGREDVLSGLSEMFVSFKSGALSWIQALLTKVTQRLTHRVTILEELDLGDQTGIDQVFYELIRDMNDNTITVNRSTITLSAVTDDKQETDAGTIIIGKILDGASDPGFGLIANPEYTDQDSELAVTDIHALTCLADSNNGGTVEGSEQFQWVGRPKPSSKFNWETPGSGSGPQILPLNSYTLLSNLEFNDFTANAPDSWDVDTGTAGTHIDDETADMYHGTAALKLTGDGALGTIQISQTLDTSLIVADKRYAVACYVKGTAGMSAGTLIIQFEGTGYTPGATEKISMAFGDLAAQTTYGLEYFFVNMPEIFPDDFELVIKISGTPSAHAVKIDRLCFGPVDWFNGHHASIVCGADKFVRGDRFTYTATNDEVGVFQTFFRDGYGVQLPSSGTPSIDDALAT